MPETAAADAAAGGPFAGYHPPVGVYDEVRDETGAVRPHWRAFHDRLARLRPDEIERRTDAAARHMREADVYHRVFEGGRAAMRSWPLSPTPLILAPSDWSAISAGVAQRAELIDALLADIYGPQKFVRDGVLPAAAVAGSSEFLRPMAGVTPRGGRFLRIYAADLGRGPDGAWRVIADRTQAPSGAGYALENRIAVSRAWPDLFRGHDPERLAGFFAALREALMALGGAEFSSVAVLTPGALSETYFEHAYLARYLGFQLIEGEDLIVRGDEAFVRTVEGLERVGVLLRRLDADFADPLELNAASRIGAPGLVRAARAGKVAIANALGAGLAESRALLRFLPALCETALGQSLALANTRTWWCGAKADREHVLEHLDALSIAPAFRQTGAAPFQRGAVAAASLDATQRARLIEAIHAHGADYVAQEHAPLSTMPCWRGARFEPRPFALRVYAAAGADGVWRVMPGGFARIADEFDPSAASLQDGGRSADVWVLSDTPAEPVTLLTGQDAPSSPRDAKPLTSRAADNLFWLGRYLERAEAALRLARALGARLAEGADESQPVIADLAALLCAWNAAPDGETSAEAAFSAALTRADLFGSAPALAEAARAAASAVRDRLAPDCWRAILDLRRALGVGAAEANLDRADIALRAAVAFSGAAQENMTRAHGWRFLEIGRRIERAIVTSRFLRTLAGPAASAGGLEALLELGDSQIAYAQRFFLTMSRSAVIGLLALDPANPRSCAFQIEELRNHVDRLPGHFPGEALTQPQRLLARLVTELQLADPSSIDEEFLMLQEDALMALSNALSDRYMLHRDETELDS